MPPALLPGRWALTPPFHPYPHREPFADIPKVFLRSITGLRAAGGIVSVALSVTQPFPAAPLALPGALPFLCSRRVVSGLSSRPSRLRVPGQRSSSSPASLIISRYLHLLSALFLNLERHRIAARQVRESKDFLVQETEQQARIEGISLSDLEKRIDVFHEEAKTRAKDDSELSDAFRRPIQHS